MMSLLCYRASEERERKPPTSERRERERRKYTHTPQRTSSLYTHIHTHVTYQRVSCREWTWQYLSWFPHHPRSLWPPCTRPPNHPVTVEHWSTSASRRMQPRVGCLRPIFARVSVAKVDSPARKRKQRHRHRHTHTYVMSRWTNHRVPRVSMEKERRKQRTDNYKQSQKEHTHTHTPTHICIYLYTVREFESLRGRGT
jgi:hypothetical protein